MTYNIRGLPTPTARETHLAVQPDRGSTSSRGGTPQTQLGTLGVAPALILIASLGLLAIALGNNAARRGVEGGDILFWLGLGMIYAPIAFRLMGAQASRRERIALVIALAASLYLVTILRSPAELTRFDEFGWWRATQELVSTGHTFTATQLNAASAGYPSLPLVTDAVVALGGLSIFHSALLVIGVARMAFVIGLFIFFEKLTDSDRAAGVAVVVYACNSSFAYFDAQFSYESLALTLALALLLLSNRWSESDRFFPDPIAWGIAAIGLLLACGLTTTHHLTSLFVVSMLILWTFAWLAMRHRLHSIEPNGPVIATLVIGLTVTIWLGFIAGVATLNELEALGESAFNSVRDLLFGTSGPKRLYSGAGQSATLIERGLVGASIIAVLGVTAAGILALWKRRPLRALWVALAVVALLYPVSLGLRLTQASSEIAGRAPAFAFLGIAFLAGFLSRSPRPAILARWPDRVFQLGMTLLALVAFLGAFMLGELKITRQPGPFIVGAEGRSISPQGVAAARFVGSHLKAKEHFVSDRIDDALFGAYGRLDPVFGNEGRPLSTILSRTVLRQSDLAALRDQSVAYVIVDNRLSHELPAVSYFVTSEGSEEVARTRPLSPAALAKFRTAPGFSTIYTNGPLTIYATPNLTNSSPH